MITGAEMLTDNEIAELKFLAKEIKIQTLKSIASIGIGHIGGSLSIAEALAVLYGKVMNYDINIPDNPERDYFVLSKGHAGPALYSALALKGFFPMEILATLNQPDTMLPSHPDRRKTPGVDMTTGSLGQGASSACGIALGNKMNKFNNYTYVMFGDGELQEGQIWEALMFASQWELSNLIAFVDHNNLQIDGTVDEICSLGDLTEKFRSFNWNAENVNGHDVNEIYLAVMRAKEHNNDKPSVIIMETVKGNGISVFENKASSHNSAVTSEILARGLKELEETL